MIKKNDKTLQDEKVTAIMNYFTDLTVTLG